MALKRSKPLALLTAAEAAAQLHITTTRLHALSRQRIIDPHYHGAQHLFHPDDVQALAELLEAENALAPQHLSQMALRAAVSAKVTAARLEELMDYLGLTVEPLGLLPEDVIGLFYESQDLLQTGVLPSEEETMRWARRLVAITEEYLELVHAYTGEPDPWRPYMDLGKLLSGGAWSPKTRAYLTHARTNLRHVAYFYERGQHGARVAGRRFPDEHYSGKLLQRVHPRQ